MSTEPVKDIPREPARSAEEIMSTTRPSAPPRPTDDVNETARFLLARPQRGAR